MTDSFITTALAWHTDAWLQVNAQLQRGQLSHAYLLAGEADTGKRHFATVLSHALLCKNPVDTRACGECAACKLNIGSNHPDILVVEPTGTSKIIKVDQIRELKNFLETSSHSFGKRIIILDSAEDLRAASANAILKGLEEPPKDVLFLLLSDRPKAVLPTISSRAQTIRLNKPSKEQSLAWLCTELNIGLDEATLVLALASFRPMAAKAMFESGLQDTLGNIAEGLLSLSSMKFAPSKLAKDLAKSSAADTLKLMALWLSTLIKAQMSGKTELLQDDSLQQLANNLQLSQYYPRERAKGLFSLYNEVVIAQRQMNGGSNPNAQLMLEDLFTQFQQLIRDNKHLATA